MSNKEHEKPACCSSFIVGVTKHLAKLCRSVVLILCVILFATIEDSNKGLDIFFDLIWSEVIEAVCCCDAKTVKYALSTLVNNSYLLDCFNS